MRCLQHTDNKYSTKFEQDSDRRERKVIEALHISFLQKKKKQEEAGEEDSLVFVL